MIKALTKETIPLKYFRKQSGWKNSHASNMWVARVNARARPPVYYQYLLRISGAHNEQYNPSGPHPITAGLPHVLQL
jgi:hypothetical protein